MKHVFLVVLALSLASGLASGQAPAPLAASEPHDFASGLTLTPQPDLALQTLLLPLEVYRGARGDLADLAVFDAAKRPVPHALRMLERATTPELIEQKLAIFPQREQTRAGPQDLALHVERSASGAIIDVRMPATKPSTKNAPITAYIVCDTSVRGVEPGAPSDARDRDAAQPATLRGLRLSLEPARESFTLPITVEASDDLSRWQTLAEGVVIGRLEHAGQSVERLRIDLASGRVSCLRLSWPGYTLPAKLAGASFELTHARLESAPPAASVQLRSAPAGGSFELDLGAVLTLQEFLPRLPEGVLVNASLALRAEAGELPVSVFEGPLYRLRHEGTELVSPAIALAGRHARYLTFRIDQGAAALPASPLVFDVAYAAHQLLFIRHGEGDHLLAYGSYKLAPKPLPSEQLLAMLSPAVRKALPVQSASISGRVILGGASARTAPPPAPSCRTPILWAVLVAAAATLVGLALRMLRKLRQGAS